MKRVNNLILASVLITMLCVPAFIKPVYAQSDQAWQVVDEFSSIISESYIHYAIQNWNSYPEIRNQLVDAFQQAGLSGSQGEQFYNLVYDFLVALDGGNQQRAAEIADKMLALFGNGPTSETSLVTDKSADTVIRDIVMPPTKTAKEKEAMAKLRELGVPKILAGYLRYDMVEVGSSDGQITGFNFGLSWDHEKVEYGFLIPYDYFDIDNGLEAHRFGAISFCKFKPGFLDLTGNIHIFDLIPDEGDNVLFFGGGLTASKSIDMGTVVPGALVSYQYTKNDTDSETDYQHLIKAGLNLGIRAGENVSFTLYGIYNKDVTDYETDLPDDDSIDGIIECRFYLSDAFSLSGGYKKTFDLDNYESDMIFLGGLFKF